MKSKLCKMFVLFTVLCLSISSMTLVASANVSIDDGVLTLNKVTIGNRGYNTTRIYDGYINYYSLESGNYRCSHSTHWSFANSALVCTDGSNRHIGEYAHIISYTPVSPNTKLIFGYGGASVGGDAVYDSYQSNIGEIVYTFGEATVYAPGTATGIGHGWSYRNKVGADSWSNIFTKCECSRCGQIVTWNIPESPSCSWFYAEPYRTSATFTYKTRNVSTTISELEVLNCVSDINLTSTVPVTIDGGQYSGNPAINGANQFTIKKATITDKTSYQSSKFMVDGDSEQTIVTNNNATITTVKLSNPPVIIDWADFPG